MSGHRSIKGLCLSSLLCELRKWITNNTNDSRKQTIMLKINCSLTAQMFNKEDLQAVRTLRSKNALGHFQRHSIKRVPRTTPSASFLWISSVWYNKANYLQTVVFLARSDICYNQFCFQSLIFRGEAVNLHLSGANRLNNNQNNIQKV